MEALRFFDGQELKDQMRRELGKPSRRVLANFGEGGAWVAPPRGRLALQTTVFLEEIHFDLSYTAPREVGHKALAAALSALAALGARPIYATLALGLKQEQGDLFVAELLAGASSLAKRFGVDLVAEASAPSPSSTVVTITAVGEGAGKPFTASGARSGDFLAVAGLLGSSAAGLALLKRQGRGEAAKLPSLFAAHVTPDPRLDEAELLRAIGSASAVVDVRDGFTRDLYRLAEASGVGCLVEEGWLPVSVELPKAHRALTTDPRSWVLYGPEDFALLCAIPARRWAQTAKAFGSKRLPLTRVGALTPARDRIRIHTTDGETIPLVPRVWHPFARRGKTRFR